MDKMRKEGEESYGDSEGQQSGSDQESTAGLGLGKT